MKKTYKLYGTYLDNLDYDMFNEVIIGDNCIYYDEDYSFLDLLGYNRIIYLSDFFKVESFSPIIDIVKASDYENLYLIMDIESSNPIIKKFVTLRANQCCTYLAQNTSKRIYLARIIN